MALTDYLFDKVVIQTSPWTNGSSFHLLLLLSPLINPTQKWVQKKPISKSNGPVRPEQSTRKSTPTGFPAFQGQGHRRLTQRQVWSAEERRSPVPVRRSELWSWRRALWNLPGIEKPIWPKSGRARQEQLQSKQPSVSLTEEPEHQGPLPGQTDQGPTAGWGPLGAHSEGLGYPTPSVQQGPQSHVLWDWTGQQRAVPEEKRLLWGRKRVRIGKPLRLGQSCVFFFFLQVFVCPVVWPFCYCITLNHVHVTELSLIVG